ncbi:carbohydrate-binding protein [Ralstonia pickettii]|uniref:carbohydrate-binding protein n=1 Tax=Ralstonia pickettii TaxID=329 RepID=UPI001C932F75
MTSDDPSTAPYPIWSPDQSYSVGVKVVWHGNVYVAKYWTQGDDPSLSQTDHERSPWQVLGQ